jgi:hypothetical protein
MTYQPFGNRPGQDTAERDLPLPEPGNQPEPEAGNEAFPPDADKPPQRREGVVSNPDF